MGNNPSDKTVLSYDEHSILYRCENGSIIRQISPGKSYRYDLRAKGFIQTNDNIQIEGEKYFVNNNSPTFIRFDRNIYSDQIFCIQKGDYKISFLCPMSVKNVEYSKEAEKRNEIVFFGVAQNTQMMCKVNRGDLICKMVINEKLLEYQFDYVLLCENLICEHDESTGKILFIDKNLQSIVYEILPPTLCDGLGEGSLNVKYDILNCGDEYVMSIKISKEWAKNFTRDFPLFLDFRLREHDEYEFDTYSWVNRTLYREDEHRVGVVNLGDAYQQFCRMCLKLNIPKYNSDFPVKKATIRVKYKKGSYKKELPKIKMLKQKNNKRIGDFNTSNGYESAVWGKIYDDYIEFDFTEDYQKIADKNKYEATYIFMFYKESSVYFAHLKLMGTDAEKNFPEIIVEYKGE